MKLAISIIIPIKNEAHNLPRCLSSVSWADEIVVVDSASTDGSQQIAEAYGAKVVQFQFNGTWPKKKNWALETIRFRNEWVFILDADEFLPASAFDEFQAIISANDSDVVGWWINRKFMFMNKWLKHSYYPNWNLRLFKHRLGRYERITEADTRSGDNEVHEHIVVQGETDFLRVEMDHFAFPSIEVFVEKHNRYSNWEARVAVDRSLNSNPSKIQSKQVSWRRLLKMASHRLPFRPTLRFMFVYIYQKGFLDGVEGFYFARLHSFYEFLCVIKERELLRKEIANPAVFSSGDSAIISKNVAGKINAPIEDGKGLTDHCAP
jgi:glycosyltransferase involved in cell wall biosynthesis